MTCCLALAHELVVDETAAHDLVEGGQVYQAVPQQHLEGILCCSAENNEVAAAAAYHSMLVAAAEQPLVPPSAAAAAYSHAHVCSAADLWLEVADCLKVDLMLTADCCLLLILLAENLLLVMMLKKVLENC